MAYFPGELAVAGNKACALTLPLLTELLGASPPGGMLEQALREAVVSAGQAVAAHSARTACAEPCTLPGQLLGAAGREGKILPTRAGRKPFRF